MSTFSDNIRREKERRAKAKGPSPSTVAERPSPYEASMQAQQQPIQQQPAQQPQEQNPFMSGVVGFNTGIERLTQGALQPLFESGALGEPLRQGFQDVAQRRESDYETSRNINPGSTLTGDIIGNIGIGLPFAGGGAYALSRVPQLGQALARHPYLRTILGSVLGGAVMGGAQYVNPQESRLQNAALGGAMGGAFGVASPAFGKIGELVARGGKTGVNTALEAWKKLQKGAGNEGVITEELLSHYTPKEMSRALSNQAKGQNVGVPVTPAEASGNLIGSKHEGRLGTSPQGERNYYEFKLGQKDQEKEAISDVLNTITPSTENASEEVRKVAQSIITGKEKALQRRARPFYEQAEKQVIPANKLNQLTKDGNIESAWKDVLNDKRFQSEIEGFDPNSIKVLDEAKKRLDGQIGAAKEAGEKNLARVLSNSRDKLVRALDKVSPEYKKARSIYSEESPLIDLVRNRQIGKIAKLKDVDLKRVSGVIFDSAETDPKVLNRLRDEIHKANPDAWAKIVRNAMEKKISTQYAGKTGYHGTNFYQQILADDNTYRQFHSALKYNPSAQKRLEMMRPVFKNLINQPTPKGAAALSKSSLDVKRSSWGEAAKFLANASGGKYDQAMIDIITTDKWKRAFFDNMMDKSGPEQQKALAKLLEKASKGAKVAGNIAKESLPRAAIGKATSTSGNPTFSTENYDIYTD